MPPAVHTRSYVLFDSIALGLFALIPLAIAAFSLSHVSLRLDEAQSLWQTSRSPSSIGALIARDVHVPLYHLLLHSWREALGDTIQVARAFSLLCYILTIPAVYFLGRISYTRSVGLFAALLFALSPIMNWYGSEIRMYTLFVLLCTINQIFFIRIFKNKEPISWVFYALTAVVGTFAHYFFLLNLFAQGVFYLFNRHRFPERTFLYLGITAALVGATIIPWGLQILRIGEVAFQQPNLATPTTANFFNVFAEFIVGFQPSWLNTIVISLWPFALLGLGFFALRKRSWLSPGGAYLIFAVFLTIPFAFLFSVLVRPLFLSRYLIFTVPALYVLVSAIIAVYPARFANITRLFLIALMALSLFFMIRGGQNPVQEEYRGAITYLQEEAQADDIILISPPFTIYPIEYYYKGPAPVRTLPDWNRYARGPIPAFNPETLPQEVARLTAGYDHVWIVLSYDQGYEDQIRQYFDQNFERDRTVDFKADINLTRYKLRYDTISVQ